MGLYPQLGKNMRHEGARGAWNMEEGFFTYMSRTLECMRTRRSSTEEHGDRI